MTQQRITERVRETYFVIEFDVGTTGGPEHRYANRREVAGNRHRPRGTWEATTLAGAERFTTEGEAQKGAKKFLRSEYASGFRRIRRVRVVEIVESLKIVMTEKGDVFTPGLPLIDKVGALDGTQ